MKIFKKIKKWIKLKRQIKKIKKEMKTPKNFIY